MSLGELESIEATIRLIFCQAQLQDKNNTSGVVSVNRLAQTHQNRLLTSYVDFYYFFCTFSII